MLRESLLLFFPRFFTDGERGKGNAEQIAARKVAPREEKSKGSMHFFFCTPLGGNATLQFWQKYAPDQEKSERVKTFCHAKWEGTWYSAKIRTAAALWTIGTKKKFLSSAGPLRRATTTFVA